MDISKSFTYVISSDERTNTNIDSSYDFRFGGFSEPYDDYYCEVISFACIGGITVANNYLLFVAENLASDGYFCTRKLSNREAILAILPLSALQDAYVQSDGGAGKFTVKNCRVPKQVRFKWVKSDFTNAIHQTDVNSGGETRWILTLRLTPKIN
jgi:hypothetical protein